MQIVKHITGVLAKGTKITYLTGNHDEMLRKFAGFRLGSFQIANTILFDATGVQVCWPQAAVISNQNQPQLFLYVDDFGR